MIQGSSASQGTVGMYRCFTVDYTAMYSKVDSPLDAITRSIPWLINPEGAQD